MKTLLVVICFMLLSAANLSGQTIEDEIRETRETLAAQRKQTIAGNMQLSGRESRAFWPLYRKYRRDMDKVIDRMVNLIVDYAEHHRNLSERKAGDLLDDYLSIEEARLKLRKRYVREFKKILPITKVARFFQLENKMDALNNMDMAKKIPLAE